jgi:integrase/recombinase XerD
MKNTSYNKKEMKMNYYLKKGKKRTQQLDWSQYTLSKAEIERLMQGIYKLRDRLAIKLMYYAGLRVSEVVNLRIENIHFNDGYISIIESKGGKTRSVVPFSKDLFTELKMYISPRNVGYVLLNPKGKRITTRAIQYLVKKWGVELGVKNKCEKAKGLNCHIFRHTAARHLKDAGYEMEFIKNFLGHSSISTTMDKYGTMSLEDMKRRVENEIA